MSRRAATAVLLTAGAALALAGCQSLFRAKPAPVVPPPVSEPAATPPPAAAEPRVLFLPRPAAPPRSCVPRSLGAPPRYPDTDAALRAAPGAADRYQLLAAGRILRQQRLDELERAIAGCR